MDRVKMVQHILDCIEKMKKKHPNNVDVKETIECPICQKQLTMVSNSYNGHIWGKCETKNCLSWMM